MITTITKTDSDSFFKKIDILCICAIFFLTFNSHFVIALSSVIVFTILNYTLLGILIYTKRTFFFSFKNKGLIWWLLGFCGICLSFCHSGQSFLDLTIIFEGLLIMLFGCSNKTECYIKCSRIILLFALFHSFGIFLQITLPDIYTKVMQIVPRREGIEIQTSLSDSSGRRGFETNSGFTAGFICMGIITLLANHDKKKVYYLLLLILGSALLFTAKRSHLLFITFTYLLDYFFYSEKQSLATKTIKILFLSLGAVIALLVVDKFVNIPILREFEKTSSGIRNNEDITSSRIVLYAWAIKLFINNPILGIGWGNYRKTILNLGALKEIDTHNIYLQLLCENGLLIAIIIFVAFITFWLLTQKALKRCIKTDNYSCLLWYAPLNFSFMYQSFFLLYGLTGNPFFDNIYLITYYFALSLTISYLRIESSFSNYTNQKAIL